MDQFPNPSHGAREDLHRALGLDRTWQEWTWSDLIDVARARVVDENWRRRTAEASRADLAARLADAEGEVERARDQRDMALLACHLLVRKNELGEDIDMSDIDGPCGLAKIALDLAGQEPRMPSAAEIREADRLRIAMMSAEGVLTSKLVCDSPARRIAAATLAAATTGDTND